MLTGLVFLLSACSAGSSTPGGSTTPSSGSSTSAAGGTLPSPPSTLPNKGSPGVSVSGSGKVDYTISYSGPCTASATAHDTFSFKDIIAVPTLVKGQYVIGPVHLGAATTSGGAAGNCPSGGFSTGWNNPVNGVEMLINPYDPAKLTILPLPEVTAAFSEGVAKGMIVILPTTGGPPFSYVFTSASGLTSGQGELSCSGGITGDTVPNTLPGTPTLPLKASCKMKTSSDFKGTFSLTGWPEYALAGRIAALGQSVSMSGSGTATLEMTVGAVTLAPNVVVTPPELHFADTPVGSATAPQTVTITNGAAAVGAGNAALVIPGIGILGPAGADYKITSNSIPSGCILAAGNTQIVSSCASDPIVLNTGQSVTFQVAFAPGSTGSRDANLTIVSNDTNPYTDIALYGVGT